MTPSPNANATSNGLVPISPGIPPLDNTYGAMMLGTFGGLMLYGLTIHQVFRYAHLPSYKTDATYTKVMVCLVLLLETFHSVLSMHSCYYYSITNYTHPDALFHGTWSIDLLPVSTGLVVAVSQSFFAYRLFKFNPRYKHIVGLAVILLLGEVGISIALTIQAFVQPNLLDYQKVSEMPTGVMRGIVVVADGILTVMLTIVLHRSRTGFKSTDSMLNVLILYTINTGLLTGTASLISFILGIAFPHTLIGEGLSLWTVKVYANSMLAVYVVAVKPHPYPVTPVSLRPHRLNSRDFLSNYRTGRSGYGATPSKLSPIHRSALGTWPPSPEHIRSFPMPSSAISPDVLEIQLHTPSQHVFDIRRATGDSEAQRDVVPCGDDSGIFNDRKSEPSLEPHDSELRGSWGSSCVSQAAASES